MEGAEAISSDCAAAEELSVTDSQQVQFIRMHLLGASDNLFHVVAYRKQSAAERIRRTRRESEDQLCHDIRRNFQAIIEKFLEKWQLMPGFFRHHCPDQAGHDGKHADAVRLQLER
jgi:hypothetical protein